MMNNIGILDGILRIVLGLAIGVVGIFIKSWWGLIGILPWRHHLPVGTRSTGQHDNAAISNSSMILSLELLIPRTYVF